MKNVHLQFVRSLGSVMASTINPWEESGQEQLTTTNLEAAFDGGVSNFEVGIRNLSQPKSCPDVRVLPIRKVLF